MKNNQPPQAAHHAITTARRPDNTGSSALVRSQSTKFMARPSREPRSQCSDIGFTFLPFSRHFLEKMAEKMAGKWQKWWWRTRMVHTVLDGGGVPGWCTLSV